MRLHVQDCLANAKAYGAGKTWVTFDLEMKDGMDIGAEGSIVVKVCNDASADMIPLTSDVTEAIFKGAESSSSRGQDRSAHSTRIGLPSARKVMNAVGGSIELYQDQVNTVTCRIQFPTTIPSQTESPIDIERRSNTSKETGSGTIVPQAVTPNSTTSSNDIEAGVPEKQSLPHLIRSCVVVEDDPFQNHFYGLVLPGIFGTPAITCLGVEEDETKGAVALILSMDPPPDVVILDYMLDYSRSGGEFYTGTDLAKGLRYGGYQGLLVLRSATVFSIDGDERPEELSLFDLVVEKGTFHDFQALGRRLNAMMAERS